MSDATMDSDMIMSEIESRLHEPAVRNWFASSRHAILDSVTAVARADGIDVAEEEVRKMYVAWISFMRSRYP